MSDSSIASHARPKVDLRVIRPAKGATLSAGQQHHGFGWLASDTPVISLHAGLAGGTLMPVRLGLSPADFRALAGQNLPEAPPGSVTAAAFVFNLHIPAGPPGPAIIQFEIRTLHGVLTVSHEVTIRTRAEPGLAAPLPDQDFQPVALIERATVDSKRILHISGWAVAPDGIRQVCIRVGDRNAGEAQYGDARRDVASAHPTMKDSKQSGFSFVQELTVEELTAGSAHVTVIGNDEKRITLSAPIKLPAAFKWRLPAEITELQCEEMVLAVDGGLVVKGWAVCTQGIKVVRIALDDVLIGSVQPDESRPDVGNRFPQVRAARQAGFRFARALGREFAGQHVLELTVEGIDGRTHATSQILTTQPVLPKHLAPLLKREPPSAAEPDGPPIRYFLDTPAIRDGKVVEPVRGFMSLSGWAAARTQIARIEVFVDGVSIGRVHHGIRREDVSAALPGYNSLLSGFAMMIPPQVLRPGAHEMRLVFADTGGYEGEVTFSLVAERGASGTGPWALRRRIPQSEIDLLTAIMVAQGGAPRWRVVIAYSGEDTAPALAATLQSLRDQAFAGWDATILVSPGHALTTELALAACTAVNRVQLVEAEPGLSLANLAEGAALLTVLAPGDRLGEDALLEMSVEAVLNSAADLIYSDEIRIDPTDGEEKAFFKPDWSPELLLSMNYIGRLWAARPPLLAASGLLAAQSLAGDEYDAVLRLSERAAAIHHLPKVLCAAVRRLGARAAERRALTDAVRRRKLRARVKPWLTDGTWQLERVADTDALVSIIIPTIASRGLIETAISSIRKLTRWPRYEIICLDNIPRAATAEQRHWKDWIAANADRSVEIRHRFNWSRSNNRGAREAKGEYLLFLNDDIEVLDADWLHRLVEQGQRPEIGVVGPQLVYPDGRVQHAGMFLAQRAARHAFRFYPRDEPASFGMALTQRDVISVTGACMLMRREVFDAMGGFDENHAVINNDLDFNLRARRAGYRVIYTPHVSLVHHEMASRAEMNDVFDSASFDSAWSSLFLKGDPFFSPHFSTDYDDFLPDAEPVKQFTVGHPLLAKSAVRRILAIKVDHIGDFMTAFPAFRRIKHHFPDAELTVVAAKASIALAGMEPAIDRTIEFNFYHARSEKGQRGGLTKALKALAAQLSCDQFDIALDLRRQPDTRQILQHTGARWLAGFDRQYQFPWLDFAVEFEGDLATHLKRDHVVDSLIRLVDAVEANCQEDRSLLAVIPSQAEARQRLVTLLAADGIHPDRLHFPLACVHTGAGSLNKQWPARSFAGLIDLLMGDAGASVVIIGGPDETQFVTTLLKLLRDPSQVINLVERIPLAELPGIIGAADLYVGNDSGPKHIAAALGVPTVGIHSGSVDAGEWGPMGPRAITMRRDVKCSPCFIARASDCHRGLACLTGIAVADVWRVCQRMLALSVCPGSA